MRFGLACDCEVLKEHEGTRGVTPLDIRVYRVDETSELYSTHPEARAAVEYNTTVDILNALDIYWRDTSPEDVVRALKGAGYVIKKAY